MSAGTSLDQQLFDLLVARRVPEAVALAQGRGAEGDEAYKRAYSAYAEKRKSERATERPQRSDEEWLNDVLSDDKPAAKTRLRRRAKPKAERFPWNFAVPPNAIWDDPTLSEAAKLAAWGIARNLNLGRWNTDLHVDLTYADFTPMHARKARRGATELKAAEYIRTENRKRGGVRYWFTEKTYRKEAGN